MIQKKDKLKLLSNNVLLSLENGAYNKQFNTLSELPSIKNAGMTNNWYDLSFKATPRADYYASQNNGFKLSKGIYTMEGQEANLSNITQNTRLLVAIAGRIENNAIQHPLLTDWIPAGFELENPNLTGVDAVSTLKWLKKQSNTEHKAYRNDHFAAALTIDSDLRKNGFVLAYVVRAVSAGSFTLPPAKIEDMYQPGYRAYSEFLQSKLIIGSTQGNTTTVVKPKVGKAK